MGMTISEIKRSFPGLRLRAPGGGAFCGRGSPVTGVDEELSSISARVRGPEPLGRGISGMCRALNNGFCVFFTGPHGGMVVEISGGLATHCRLSSGQHSFIDSVTGQDRYYNGRFGRSPGRGIAGSGASPEMARQKTLVRSLRRGWLRADFPV